MNASEGSVARENAEKVVETRENKIEAGYLPWKRDVCCCSP